MSLQHLMPEYHCEGSIAIFDNRACRHYASVDYLGYLRKGYRVTIGGDGPFFDPEREAKAKVEAKLGE